jgi:hypothetical protein
MGDDGYNFMHAEEEREFRRKMMEFYGPSGRAYRGRNVDPQHGGLLIHHTMQGAQVAPTYGTKEQETMSPFETDPRSELEKQREELEAQLARLTRKLSALEQLPDLDASPDEAVILWKRTYRSDNVPTQYTYVGIKRDGRWFTTASRGDSVFTSAELAEKHLIRADEVWTVSGWVTPTAGEPIPVYTESE